MAQVYWHWLTARRLSPRAARDELRILRDGPDNTLVGFAMERLMVSAREGIAPAGTSIDRSRITIPSGRVGENIEEGRVRVWRTGHEEEVASSDGVLAIRRATALFSDEKGVLYAHGKPSRFSNNHSRHSQWIRYLIKSKGESRYGATEAEYYRINMKHKLPWVDHPTQWSTKHKRRFQRRIDYLDELLNRKLDFPRGETIRVKNNRVRIDPRLKIGYAESLRDFRCS